MKSYLVYNREVRDQDGEIKHHGCFLFVDSVVGLVESKFINYGCWELKPGTIVRDFSASQLVDVLNWVNANGNRVESAENLLEQAFETMAPIVSIPASTHIDQLTNQALYRSRRR